MKNLIKLAFFLLPLSVFSTMLFFACQKDPCAGIVCQNGGTCLNGQCSCPNGYEGPACEKEKTPSYVTISSIDLYEYPPTRQNGTGWDPLDAPDLLIQIINVNGIAIYAQTNPVNDVKVSQLPLSFIVPSSLRFTDVSTVLFLQLMDFDSFSSNERMALSPFVLYEKGKKFPKEIEVGAKGTGFWAKINVIHQF